MMTTKATTEATAKVGGGHVRGVHPAWLVVGMFWLVLCGWVAMAELEPTQAGAQEAAGADSVNVAHVERACQVQPSADYDTVETYVYTQFQLLFCDGDMAVRVIRCEGWNATANWDVTHIRADADAGIFQVNAVHGRRDGVIEGRWPQAVQTVEGATQVASWLYADSGWQPWYMSRSCWGRYVGTFANVQPMPAVLAPTAPTAPTATAEAAEPAAHIGASTDYTPSVFADYVRITGALDDYYGRLTSALEAAR